MYTKILILLFVLSGAIAQRTTRGFFDGCNYCTSINEIGTACTERWCPACAVGDIRHNKDQTCYCQGDQTWECRAKCSPDIKSVYDGCNNCMCNNGLSMACTLMACTTCRDGELKYVGNTDCLCIKKRWSCKIAF